MKTITIPGFITGRIAEDWRKGEPNVVGDIYYDWRPYETREGEKKVTAHAIVFDVPDDFDPTAEAVAQLDAQEKEVMAKAESMLNIIRELRNKILAISYEVEPA